MRRTRSGFSLTELAVVMAIVALLFTATMYTLSAQIEQRNRNDTQRRLEEAKELLLSFALINGRLPCPARAVATAAPVTQPGDEVWTAATGQCRGDSVDDYLGGTISVGPPVVGGFLPGRTIGFQPVDAFGFAIDAWGNRLRYAVSRNYGNPPSGTSCGDPAVPTVPGFTSAVNLKTNGIACAPRDIVICTTAAGSTPGVPPSCAAGTSVTNQRTVAAIVHSTGKNTTVACGTCADEAENIDGDGVFVWHDPRPTGGAGGEYDDMMVWIPASVLYSRLIAAGVLP